jgi:hypothetical protein
MEYLHHYSKTAYDKHAVLDKYASGMSSTFKWMPII